MIKRTEQLQPPHHTPGLWLDLGILWLLALGMVWLGWIGYHGIDDLGYAIAAADWATEGPTLGDNHWALRYPVVIPISIAFFALGINEVALVLPSILSFLCIVSVTYWFVRAHFDRISGLATAVLVATTPQFSNYASWAGVELLEVLLICLSLWSFASAASPKPGRLLFWSGLLAGLAWGARETAASLLIVYSVCFVLGYRYARIQYVTLAAGALAVIVIELTLLGIIAGDPFYRFEVDMAHAQCTPQDASFLTRTATWHWLIAPLAVLAGDAAHGLFYVSALMVGGVVLARLDPAKRDVLILFILLALVHYVIVGYVGQLRLARYYAVITYVAVLMVGIAFGQATQCRSLRLAAYAMLVPLLSSSLIVTGLRSGDRTFAAQTVAAFVQREHSPVYTDLRTRRVATFFLLDQPGLAKLIRSDAPPPAALYFLDTSQARQQEISRTPDDGPASRAVPTGWEEIRRFHPPHPVFDRALDITPLPGMLPPRARAWRDTRLAPVVLYRTSGDTYSTLSPQAAHSRPPRCDPWLTVP